MNGLIKSNIGIASTATVTTAGVKIVTNDPRNRYIRISNLGDNAVYITPQTAHGAETCPAVAKKGIVLYPAGNYGSVAEFTNDSMFFCDFWAVTEEGTSEVAVLVGRG
jgi:hypothetical protein